MSDNQKKSQKPIERATVAEDLRPKLQSMCEQANAALNGIATVTKSDVVCLILEQHHGVLSSDELEALRAKHFDEVRFALWMANKLKEARDAGESLSIKELMAQGQSILDTVPRRAVKRTRRKRQPVELDDSQTDAPTTNEPPQV